MAELPGHALSAVGVVAVQLLQHKCWHWTTNKVGSFILFGAHATIFSHDGFQPYYGFQPYDDFRL